MHEVESVKNQGLGASGLSILALRAQNRAPPASSKLDCAEIGAAEAVDQMNRLRILEFLGVRLVVRMPITYRAGAFFIGVADSILLKVYERWKKSYVIVYQQGRVGSTSVYEALSKHQAQYPVFHLHTMSLSHATRLIEGKKKQNSKIDRNVILSKKVALSIRSGCERNLEPPRHKIITIVREPIGLMLSLIFMRGKTSLQEFLGVEDDLHGLKSAVLFKERLERDDPAQWMINRWFEEVLPSELGVDLLSRESIGGNGFGIFRSSRYDICVLKFERLNESFGDAMSEFLGLSMDHAKLEIANIHGDKKYHDLHRYLKGNLKLSSDFCRRAYSTPTMQHFYSEAEREVLIEKWSKLER